MLYFFTACTYLRYAFFQCYSFKAVVIVNVLPYADCLISPMLVLISIIPAFLEQLIIRIPPIGVFIPKIGMDTWASVQ